MHHIPAYLSSLCFNISISSAFAKYPYWLYFSLPIICIVTLEIKRMFNSFAYFPLQGSQNQDFQCVVSNLSEILGKQVSI